MNTPENKSLDNNDSSLLAESYLSYQESTIRDSQYITFVDSLSCCAGAVDEHAEMNPIMVCGECRFIIKCFRQERPFKNFLHFCHSKQRKVVASKYKGFFIATYYAHGNI